MRRRLVRTTLVTLALATAPLVAHAAPGGGPLVNFGQGVLDFLTGVLGPIIFGLGLAAAAVSLVIGSREGMQKALYAVLGGGLLFSIGSVVDFVSRVAH